MAGAEVRARRPALQPVGEQRAQLRQRQLGGVAGRLAHDVVEDPLQLGALPGIARRRGSEGVGGNRQRGRPFADRLRGDQRVDRRSQAIDELGEAAGEVDRAALDVVERQHALEQPLVVLAHRDAEQHAVEPGLPRAAGQLIELERPAVRGVEPPADAARAHPLLQAPEVVVVEVEAPADGLAVGEVEHLRGGQPLAGELDQPGDDAEHRVGLPQRAVGEPHAQVGRRALEGLDLVVTGAERRLDQWRERLDVRAHHDHVARLERRVVGKQVQDRVAQHLDLAGAAVAGVDLDAAVHGVRAAAVLAHVFLYPGEQRVGAGGDRVLVVHVRAAEHELQLARVVPPRGEQGIGGALVDLGAAGHGRAVLQPLPQRGRGVQQEQVDVAVRGERAQDVEVAGRQAREPEQREPRREVDEAAVGVQRPAGRAAPLRRPGHREPLAQPPPQLGLPVLALAGRPALEHLRPVQRVAVEQLGHVADAREAPRAAVLVIAEVVGEQLQPRLVQRRVDDLQQRPDRALGPPRVRFGVDPRGGGDRVGDQPSRWREVDVRAHAVRPPGRDPERRGHPLGEPALHPARGHGDDLARERIRERIGE